MRRSALFASLSLLSLLSIARADDVSTDPKRAPAGAYQIEPRHTQVLFAIVHFGITDYYGRFEKVSGTLNFNPGTPEKSSVAIAIDTSSTNVMSGQLINEIVGPNVFDSAHFPEATFKSTAIERTGPTSGKITGDLTIHGVTKSVTFDVIFKGGLVAPVGASAYDIGFHATATIKRSDFGLDRMIWASFVSDDVKLIIEAMFQQQKA